MRVVGVSVGPERRAGWQRAGGVGVLLQWEASYPLSRPCYTASVCTTAASWYLLLFLLLLLLLLLMVVR